MTQETYDAWVARFRLPATGDQAPSDKDKAAWVEEFARLGEDDQRALREELDGISDATVLSAEDIAAALRDLSDRTAERAARRWESALPAASLETGAFALLYRLVAGYNGSVAPLPPMVHELGAALRSLLAEAVAAREAREAQAVAAREAREAQASALRALGQHLETQTVALEHIATAMTASVDMLGRQRKGLGMILAQVTRHNEILAQAWEDAARKVDERHNVSGATRGAPGGPAANGGTNASGGATK